MVMDSNVRSSWWLLRIVFGVVPIVAGLDKFLGLLADWEAYLSPLARSLLPMSAHTFMLVVGVIEIAAGVLTLARPRIGAWVVSAWLVAIALQLLTTGKYFDVAVRDLVMASGAYVLGRLSAAQERSPRRATQRVPTGLGAPTPEAV
jgi:uncharacterized membrane protein YphA (DoxX/SURF4 family)